MNAEARRANMPPRRRRFAFTGGTPKLQQPAARQWCFSLPLLFKRSPPRESMEALVDRLIALALLRQEDEANPGAGFII